MHPSGGVAGAPTADELAAAEMDELKEATAGKENDTLVLCIPKRLRGKHRKLAKRK